MRIIVFPNQKGGVGKTTSVINIAAVFGKMGHKSLIIDLDPQGNSSIGVGITEDMLINKVTVYDCIVNERPINDAIMHTEFENIDIVPSYLLLADADLQIAAVMGRESLLKESITNGDLSEYEFVLIDVPPFFNLLFANGLNVASEIIIPVKPDAFSLAGINQLIRNINNIKKKLNPNLSITGVLITDYYKNTKLSKDMKKTLEEIFDNKIFDTTISHNVKISEAQGEGKPIIYYDKNCQGAIDYSNAAKEIILRG